MERLLSFSRTELALARFAALAVGVPPDEARAGDKRDRDEADGDHGDEEEDGSETRLLAEAQAALRDAEASAEAVPTERLRALQAQIYAALERGLLRPELARALRSVAARLQTAELTRDASATQMDYDAEEEADDDEDGGPSDALASGVEEEEGSIEPVELELRIEPGDGPEVRLVKRVLQRARRARDYPFLFEREVETEDHLQQVDDALAQLRDVQARLGGDAPMSSSRADVAREERERAVVGPSRRRTTPPAGAALPSIGESTRTEVVLFPILPRA